MTISADSLDLPAPPSLWRRSGVATALGAAATIGVGCGTLAVLRRGVAGEPHLTMGALFATTIWIGLAAGPLAAGADDWLGALLRGGAPADAGVVTLLAVGLWGDADLTWGAAARVYLLWAPLAVTASLATRWGRSALARGGIALGMAIVAAVTMGSLFWSPGMLEALPADRRWLAASVILWPNALAGLADAAGQAGGFVWAEQPVMYAVTRMGQDVPPPPLAWWMPAIVWWTAAAAMAVGLAARHGLRRFFYGT